MVLIGKPRHCDIIEDKRELIGLGQWLKVDKFNR